MDILLQAFFISYNIFTIKTLQEKFLKQCGHDETVKHSNCNLLGGGAGTAWQKSKSVWPEVLVEKHLWSLQPRMGTATSKMTTDR